MIDAERFFIVSAAIGSGPEILSRVYFQYPENRARRELPSEMRTPGAIRNIYDGAVRLNRDTAGAFLPVPFFSVGPSAVISRGMWAAFSFKQSALK